jgi:4-hydroxybenzoate polyprenyltransferase
MQLPALIRAMRPHQWAKNVFVLAAFGFALGNDEFEPNTTTILGVVLAFFAFSFGASAIYLINDILDVNEDRIHPTKRNRPIAAGEVSVPVAIGLAIALAIIALGLAFAAAPGWVLPTVVGSYMVMNLAYSLKLKHVVLVDVFCIATGFLLRVLGGGIAVHVEVSHWLLLCTFFLALFLALNKRRAELALAIGGPEGVGATRSSLRGYNLGLLDQLVTMISACTIVCYALYTVDPLTIEKFRSGELLVGSVPFVVFGLARYLYLVQTEGRGESPTKIFLGGDLWFLGDLIAWTCVVALAVAF